MLTRKALILACDLTSDGKELGPKSILRLERGLEHARETGDQLVVAAGMSPRHPGQTELMSVMMAKWLAERGYHDTIVLKATLFNTLGELREFLKLPRARVIVSAPWHLRRTWIIIKREFGHGRRRQLRGVPVMANRMSTKERFLLEPLKMGFELLMYVTPRRLRAPMHASCVRLFDRFGINPSW